MLLLLAETTFKKSCSALVVSDLFTSLRSDCPACNLLRTSAFPLHPIGWRHRVAGFTHVIGMLCYEWIMEIAVIISEPDPLHVYNISACVFSLGATALKSMGRKYQYGLHQAGAPIGLNCSQREGTLRGYLGSQRVPGHIVVYYM